MADPKTPKPLAQSCWLGVSQVQLLTLLASCGSKEGGDMAEMFHVHLESAAQRRYQLLVATLGALPGESKIQLKPNSPSQPVQRSRGSLPPACSRAIQYRHAPRLCSC